MGSSGAHPDGLVCAGTGLSRLSPFVDWFESSCSLLFVAVSRGAYRLRSGLGVPSARPATMSLSFVGSRPLPAPPAIVCLAPESLPSHSFTFPVVISALFLSECLPCTAVLRGAALVELLSREAPRGRATRPPSLLPLPTLKSATRNEKTPLSHRRSGHSLVSLNVACRAHSFSRSLGTAAPSTGPRPPPLLSSVVKAARRRPWSPSVFVAADSGVPRRRLLVACVH